jgi:hypothetical protein
MLVPPSSSDLLGCTSSVAASRITFPNRHSLAIDPTKLTKPRQFARTAQPSRDVDTSLWTETPAERQARLADEVSGKRRRAVNADPDMDESKQLAAQKRRKYEQEVRKGVEEHTVSNIAHYVPSSSNDITEERSWCGSRGAAYRENSTSREEQEGRG